MGRCSPESLLSSPVGRLTWDILEQGGGRVPKEVFKPKGTLGEFQIPRKRMTGGSGREALVIPTRELVAAR